MEKFNTMFWHGSGANCLIMQAISCYSHKVGAAVANAHAVLASSNAAKSAVSRWGRLRKRTRCVGEILQAESTQVPLRRYRQNRKELSRPLKLNIRCFLATKHILFQD